MDLLSVRNVSLTKCNAKVAPYERQLLLGQYRPLCCKSMMQSFLYTILCNILLHYFWFSKLEKLENPNRNPVVVYTENPKMADLKRGLSVEDQELVNRLSKLKSDIREMKSVPTQEEIEERLAKLKDIDPQVYRKPAIFSKPKTGVDEATELINQMREEVSIDRQSDLPPFTPDQQSTQVLLFHFKSHFVCFSGVNYSFSLKDPNDVEMLLQNEALAIQADAKMALEGLAKDKEIQER